MTQLPVIGGLAMPCRGADVHLLVADCGLAADMRRVASELKEKEVGHDYGAQNESSVYQGRMRLRKMLDCH